MAQVAVADGGAGGVEAAIDRGHLARMTLGNEELAREVLQLFDRQASLAVARIRTGDEATVATLAHTLKGSARGIGAWAVGQAAEAVERAGPADRRRAIERLANAVGEARAAIAALLPGIAPAAE